VKGLFDDLDGWIGMWIRCLLKKKKKAVKHQDHRKTSNLFAATDLISLARIKAESFLLSTTGQPQRKAVYGKTVRTV
jgi:hypothetical protein